MASIGHVAVGLCAGRFGYQRRGLVAAMLGFSVLSLLPDADAIGFLLRVPYAAPFGHRGASHSLVCALACGGLCALCGWLAGLRGRALWRLWWLSTGVVASHGLLDALTRGGLGAALLWPFTTRRYFAPWRPLPVAPIGLRLLSPRGLHVMAVELLAFSPLFLYALWPRRTGSAG